MQNLVNLFRKLSVTKQYFFARTFYDWGIYIFDAFYMTYVFKESGEVQQVVYNIVLTLVTIYFGIMLGSVLMKKVGAERNMRLSFIMLIITGLVGIYLVNIGAVSFIIVSLLRGLGEGLYWASANFVELSGLPEDSRSKYYSFSHGVNGIFNIIAPITLGYILNQVNSLLPSFLLFTAICIVAVFVPFDFKINNKISINKEKFLKIKKSPIHNKFVVIKSVLAGMWMLDWLLASIIPFVILGNELNMGVYLTFSSLMGIIISLFTVKTPIAKKMKYGVPLVILSALADLSLLFSFTPLVLYINSILLSLTGSVVTPVEYDMGMRITNTIDRNNDMGVELNIYQEGVYTIARVAIGMIVIGVIALGLSVISILKVLLVMVVTLKLINYFFSPKLLELAKAS